MRRILVTGALGQIGSELVPALREHHGADQVVASDVRMSPGSGDAGPFEYVDCVHMRQIEQVVRRYDVGTIYHLAALLSAVAEEKPRLAWELNMGGLYRVLEVARQFDCAVFLPSSIGAFGPTTAHASISVPSTVKCSSDNSPAARACSNTAWKKLSAISPSSKPIAILREHRHVPDSIVHLEPHEPTEQQVVLELLHQHPLAANRVEHLKQQGPQQLLRRHRRPPVREYSFRNFRSNRARARFVISRVARSGWSAGIRASGDT